MAFENVNVTQLRNSINNCKDSINYSSSEEIISKIANNDIWQSASRDNMSKALNKLINERYKKLEQKLDDYLIIADKIEQYQKLSSSQQDCSSIIADINSKINDMELKQSDYENNGKASSDEAIKNKEEISSLKDKLKSTKSKKNDAENDMAVLKSSIEDLL